MPINFEKFYKKASDGKFHELIKALNESPTDQTRQSIVDFMTFSGKDTFLHLAASHGNDKAVSALLSAGAKPGQLNALHETALHIAVTRGHAKIVSSLLETDPEKQVDSVDEVDQTPLGIAAKNGRADIVKLLLDKKARVDFCSDDETPLALAAKAGHYNVANLLLDYSANVNHMGKSGLTPLAFATQAGHADVVQLLLDRDADPALGDKTETSPIACAVNTSHFEIAKSLLERVKDINAVTIDKSPLLLWMIKMREKIPVTEFFNLLITKGADVSQQPDKGFSPLICAINFNAVDIVKIMLQSSHAKVDSVVLNTPLLLWVIQKQKFEIAKLLIEAGANVNHADDSGTTPLSYTIDLGHKDMAKLLIEHDADVNVKIKGMPLFVLALKKEQFITKTIALLFLKSVENINLIVEQKTLFELVLEHPNLREKEVIEQLITKEANIKGTIDGKPWLVWIIEQPTFKGKQSIINLLIQKGADINQADEDGTTPLFHAIQMDNTAIVLFLIKEMKADINLPVKGKPLFAWALERTLFRKEATIELFINQDTDLKQLIHGKSWLSWILEEDALTEKQEIIKLSIENGADINQATEASASPLLIALRNGDLSMINLLLDIIPKQETELEKDQFLESKKLLDAIRHQPIEVVQTFLSSEKICIQENVEPLLLSILLGRINISELLLDHIENINNIKVLGRSLCEWVLHLKQSKVTDNQDIDKILELINTKLETRTKTIEQESVKDHVTPPSDTTSMLLKKLDYQPKQETTPTPPEQPSPLPKTCTDEFPPSQISPNQEEGDTPQDRIPQQLPILHQQDHVETTPLLDAIFSDNINWFNEILETDKTQSIAQLNKACQAQAFPLLVFLLDQQRAEIALALIDAGVNLNSHDRYGNTPLLSAIFHGELEIATQLIRHGANINLTNVYGEAPLNMSLIRMLNFHDTPFSLIHLLVVRGANIDSLTLQLVDILNRDDISSLIQASKQGTLLPPTVKWR